MVFGNVAVGPIAIGNVAVGYVAIGMSLAVGPIAISINSIGFLLAIGVNAGGLISLAAVNGIGAVCVAGVNGIGGLVFALVNTFGTALVPLALAAAEGAGAFYAHAALPKRPRGRLDAPGDDEREIAVLLLAANDEGLRVRDAARSWTIPWDPNVPAVHRAEAAAIARDHPDVRLQVRVDRGATTEGRQGSRALDPYRGAIPEERSFSALFVALAPDAPRGAADLVLVRSPLLRRFRDALALGAATALFLAIVAFLLDR